jgi:hypothetical protein
MHILCCELFCAVTLLWVVVVVSAIDDSGNYCQGLSLLGLNFLMESLILAQDERWRRA